MRKITPKRSVSQTKAASTSQSSGVKPYLISEDEGVANGSLASPIVNEKFTEKCQPTPSFHQHLPPHRPVGRTHSRRPQTHHHHRLRLEKTSWPEVREICCCISSYLLHDREVSVDAAYLSPRSKKKNFSLIFFLTRNWRTFCSNEPAVALAKRLDRWFLGISCGSPRMENVELGSFMQSTLLFLASSVVTRRQKNKCWWIFCWKLSTKLL
jgi:hypothetical protein